MSQNLRMIRTQNQIQSRISLGLDDASFLTKTSLWVIEGFYLRISLIKFLSQRPKKNFKSIQRSFWNCFVFVILKKTEISLYREFCVLLPIWQSLKFSHDYLHEWKITNLSKKIRVFLLKIFQTLTESKSYPLPPFPKEISLFNHFESWLYLQCYWEHFSNIARKIVMTTYY